MTLQKTRYILFSSEMVRAIIEGRKTQTRRVTKFSPSEVFVSCPYGHKGDQLWVKENFYVRVDGPALRTPQSLHYAADLLPDDPLKRGYILKPSIHMPRWASRITLTVTDVRVQRLQEITPADARAEGCPEDLGSSYCVDGMSAQVAWFMFLWNKINAARGHAWEANPWVWAVTFEREGV